MKRIKGIKTGFDYSGDIYSIGMIITELLLGVKLWRNMNEFDIIRVSFFKAASFLKISWILELILREYVESKKS